MIALWIAIAKSLAISYGGKIGNLIVQVADTAEAAIAAKLDIDATIGPWISWINGIILAKRDLTPEEDAAANAFADAVHANNQSLGTGGPGVAIPAPPA